MGIFDWFNACSDKEREAARGVIAAGTARAVSGLRPLYAEYPAARTIAGADCRETFVYCYTVAFAVMAMVGARMYFPAARRESTTKAITSELEKWRRGAYEQDGRQLLSQLNISNAPSAEACLACWLVDRVDGDAGEPVRELKKETGLMTALGKLIIARSAEAAVEHFLEDKNR